MKQPFCTASLHQGESPKFLQPYPKAALLEGGTQHLTGMVPPSCPLSHSSEHPCEGTDSAEEAAMGIKAHEGTVAPLLSVHPSPRSALCEQHLTWRGGFSTWGASSPRTTGQAQDVCLDSRGRSMPPSCPAPSHSHLILPDRAGTTVRALLKGEAVTTQPPLLTEQCTHCHFLKRP